MKKLILVTTAAGLALAARSATLHYLRRRTPVTDRFADPLEGRILAIERLEMLLQHIDGCPPCQAAYCGSGEEPPPCSMGDELLNRIAAA